MTDPEALVRPERKRDDWYVPGHVDRAPVDRPDKAPRKPWRQRHAEYPMPNRDGEWQWRVNDPEVRIESDGWAVNGTVAMGPMIRDGLPFEQVPARIAASLVDFEDERGRVPSERC